MSLPYDKTNAASIFDYSKGLLGRTLRDFVWEGYEPKRGKGSLGQMVENIYFLLETNSNPASDFSEDGLELKCTPLKKSKKEELLIKERLVCNMISYYDVVNEDFEHSHFFLKCQLMLLLFYLHQTNVDNLDLEFLLSVLWKLPKKDLMIIRHDYEVPLCFSSSSPSVYQAGFLYSKKKFFYSEKEFFHSESCNPRPVIIYLS